MCTADLTAITTASEYITTRPMKMNQSGCICGAIVATTLYRNAVPTPPPISADSVLSANTIPPQTIARMDVLSVGFPCG